MLLPQQEHRIEIFLSRSGFPEQEGKNNLLGELRDPELPVERFDLGNISLDKSFYLAKPLTKKRSV